MSTGLHTPRCVLVTGAAGFIGTNFVGYLLATHPDVRVVSYDALTYAGCLASLQTVAAPFGDRHRFVHGAIQDTDAVTAVFAAQQPDTVVHLAAESHVDRSIDAPAAFLDTNITGTYVLLQAARAAWSGRTDVRFHHVSTDEVYGSLGDEGLFSEESGYDPSSPYSASKAASDHLVGSWFRTYGLPVTLSNCSNNYGPYQFPEKLLPLMIHKAISGEALPVYGDGQHVRDWLYVQDHCRALATVVCRGEVGRAYNVGARCESKNIDTVRLLCRILNELSPRDGGGSYAEQIEFTDDRPGHDRRYAIDPTRIETQLGWRAETTFQDGLRRTVKWYLDHQDWVRGITQRRYHGQRLGLR